MIEVKGIIEKVSKENNNGSDKKIVTLSAGKHNKLYVEFQGTMLAKLQTFKVGDFVEIRIRFNGKESKLGRKYNNIVAKSIKSI